ncbi:hypothetical protein [Methylovulum psychrotolerans]|uniref:Uncharacterized protein n=1 Tax=Methylovulum psychrotolerans TaxID=1704499 RepID=A0A2S5CKQ7_9GAMM|nr:hypothetical protein [Methylovulum psychrotolerans]POZ51366.1 hypothetical protein AADEFJLK_02815 [Methylovulum psychrotolerans]
MNLKIIEKHFGSYLEKYWQLSDIAPFLFVYIELLLLFKNELSQVELNVVLERQKQLRGEEFADDGFDELMNLSRKEVDRDIGNNTSTTRKGMLNRLLFCALLDTEENDFFYLTEPVFEFVRKMEISPDQLKRILESAFVGLKI